MIFRLVARHLMSLAKETMANHHVETFSRAFPNEHILDFVRSLITNY